MNRPGDQIPWFIPSLDEADESAVRETIVSSFVNAGPKNAAFEETLKEYFDVSHALFTPSGTLSIALALMALGVTRGDTVLVPDMTFIGSASAVRLTGAEPILVDVDPESYVMDPDDARRRMDDSTRAILPVHLNGRHVPMDAIRKLAEERHLAVVEDAAEAIACKTSSGYLGTLGDAGCFSLAPTKIITSGQGGFILTNRDDLRDAVVRLKDHGRLSRASDEHPVTGFNFKVTDMQAALALSQWKKLPSRIDRVLQMDERYVEGLKDIDEINFTPRPETGSYLMWPDFKTARRDELVAFAAARDITFRPFWPALHMQPAYASTDDYPGATEASRHACWLPSSPDLSDEQIDRVIDIIRSFFGA